jgi:hypothetical protein
MKNHTINGQKRILVCSGEKKIKINAVFVKYREGL